MKRNIFILSLGLLSASSFAAETRYFVASYFLKNEQPDFSFIVPISEPGQILHARLLARSFPIELGETVDVSGKFISVTIEKGNDGFNQDFGGTNVLWNWQVVELGNFFDFSVGLPPVLAVNPLTIGLNLETFLTESDGSGNVSLSGYTITGELPFQPSFFRADGSKESWFGSYRDGYFPWIRHETFGDLFVSGMDPENIWFWSEGQQTWFFTRESHGNFIYRSSDGVWLFRSESSQWFYNFSSQEWEFGAL